MVRSQFIGISLIWLRNSLGDPKKTEFKVSESEISLGNLVVPASEVQTCRVGDANKWLGPLNIAIYLGLSGWFFYEFMSFLNRLLIAITAASTPGADAAATQASTVQLLQKFHLRASITEEQQTQLWLGIYVFILVYQIFVAPYIFRPRMVLTAQCGSVVEVAYCLIPQRTFKVVVMVFVGALFGAWMQGLFSSPADFLKWSFVLLAIPD